MSAVIPPLVPPRTEPWRNPERYWSAVTEATHGLDSPVGVIDHGALSANAFDMIDRAHGVPIRVASKSVRVRAVLDAVLDLPGFSGVLAYTLPEALWLAETIDDVVVGYPSADRTAIARLASSPELAQRVTVMIDSEEQLDLIDSVCPPSQREAIRVAIELDVAYRSRVFGRLGVWRSPVRTAEDAGRLAEAVVRRDGFRLVGMMAYESQIAGVPASGKVVRDLLLRDMHRRSFAELQERRAAAVAAVSEHADLEFVNGGGTGSLHLTSGDSSVTELGAGSGLLAGHIFDDFAAFEPAPASAWGLTVVRKPTRDRVTVLGGGWVASGPAGADRLPKVAWPQGLAWAPHEQAGEVQSPLTGAAAADMRVGDTVWFRHAKSGEASEHLNEFAVIQDGAVVATVPTYRGEGKAFL